MIELVYETHSTTTDNEAGIATGWLPGQLSTAGRVQARELSLHGRALEALVDAPFAWQPGWLYRVESGGRRTST